MSAIYVTGDTHGGLDLKKLNTKNFPAQKGLTKADCVIIAGDFGLVWDGSREERYWLDWLRQKSFTTLFVDGNHENFDLLQRYPVEYWYGGSVRRIYDGIYHLLRGQIFQLGGVRIFAFGGAPSHDREYRAEGISWWPEEMPSEAEFTVGLFNLAQNDWTVDYIITHTCPSHTCVSAGLRLETSPVNRYFDSLDDKVKYNHWYFGHYHQDLIVSPRKTALYKNVVRIS